jgi:hypothetical protein
MLMQFQNKLSLVLFLFGKMFLQIVITDEIKFINSLNGKYKNGIVYLLFPQISRMIGPQDAVNIIAHTQGVQLISELSEIEKKRINKEDLPPIAIN